MNTTERAVTAVAALFLALAFLLVGVSRDWPWWVVTPLVLVPVAAAVLMDRVADRGRRHGHVFPRSAAQRIPPQASSPATAASPPQRPDVRREIVSDISLRSSAPDYRFLFSATVCWMMEPERRPQHPNPSALARDAVVARARDLLAKQSPEEYSVLTEWLNAELGTMMAVARHHVYVWATDVLIDLSESDRERLRRLADMRKDEELQEQERRNERGLREYLADDALADPGRAVVWWMAHNATNGRVDLRGTVADLDRLRRLTAAAHATEVPRPDTLPHEDAEHARDRRPAPAEHSAGEPPDESG
uniref:hypothetical protein n=1 Tax=Saccharomonospora saliphila TaxID=369829 RepID=UPI000361946D